MTVRFCDFVCALLGCRRPKGADYACYFACGRCGRLSFIEAKKP